MSKQFLSNSPRVLIQFTRIVTIHDTATFPMIYVSFIQFSIIPALRISAARNTEINVMPYSRVRHTSRHQLAEVDSTVKRCTDPPRNSLPRWLTTIQHTTNGNSVHMTSMNRVSLCLVPCMPFSKKMTKSTAKIDRQLHVA